MIKKTWLLLPVMTIMISIMSCGGMHYVDASPDAADFHPRIIGVIPVEVGVYPEAKGVIDQIIADVLTDKKWFSEVVSSEAINRQMSDSDAFRKTVADFISKLKTVSFSDPELSRKIGETAKVEAFLLVNVDYWQYTKEGDDKVAKVGLNMKLVDVGTGRIYWKASHHVEEQYTLFKPAIASVAKGVARKMITTMPH